MFESRNQHHAVIAHSAEHLVGIEEAPGSKPGDGTNRPCSPIGRGPGLNPEKCGFDARRGYALVAQLAEAAVSNAACCRFDSCAAHQPFCGIRFAPFAKRQRHRFYTATFRGSSP